MNKAKKGDHVKVHYKGKLTSGEQFDSSEGREPLAFTVGAGQMIKGFDDAIPGMEPGEKKTITIAPENAYGEKNKEAIIEFPKSNIPEDMTLEPGMKLQLQNQAGQPIPSFGPCPPAHRRRCNRKAANRCHRRKNGIKKDPRVKLTGDFQFYTFIESSFSFSTEIVNEILFV